MELQGRNLVRGLIGADVATLQNELIQYGYKIADAEFDKKSFGDTTLDAVLDLQTKLELPPTGVVDPKTAWVMEPTGHREHPAHPEHPNKFIVIGRVRQADGTPIEGATVKAFDKDLRSEQPLGPAGKIETTKKDGDYEIFYRADEFNRAEKTTADLIVRVFNASGTTLASSTIIFNARKVEVVDFTVGDTRGPSEFDNIVREITPLLEGVPQDQLTADDVAFLAGETGFSSALLTFLAESARRRLEANTIPQFAFYGLFRQSLPTVLKELLAKEIPLLRAALELSSNQGIIPQLTATELDQIAENLRILKSILLLQPAGPGEPSSLGDLLRTSQLSVEKQRIVADLLVQHGGLTKAFWQALDQRSDFSPLEKNDARFTLQVGDLTTNHVPLVLALRGIAPPTATTISTNGDATALRPFARFGVADWKTTLQNNGQPLGAPPTIPGSTLQERMDNYSVALNQHMERVLPTPVIAGRLQNDAGSDNPFGPVKTALLTFFNNNPLYEFRKTPIDEYLREKGITGPAALVTELKNMQRLFNIAPRYAEIRSLRKDELQSALSVVRLSEPRFTEKYAGSLGGSAKAREAYRKAQQTHATALTLYLKHALTPNSAPFVISNGGMTASGAELAAVDPELQASPDLPTLFGSLDLCECEQCQSVYSPAAYLVDILRFLGNGPVKNSRNPLQVLLGRRPDLEHIELTCENTNTPLPYTDLVREILETAIDPLDPRAFKITEAEIVIGSVLTDLNAAKIPESFLAIFVNKGYPLTNKASVRVETLGQSWMILDTSWAFDLKYLGTGQGFRVGAWPQTSWNADELRASPEHVHNAAYVVLRKAVYPWSLPLILPVEETRAYLGHFDVKRHEVMKTFFRSTPVDLEDKNIAYEYLDLTKEEADIITGSTTGGPGTTPGPWDFWGLKQTNNDIVDPTDGTAPKAQGTWDFVLQRVSIFLQQSGLSYRELLEVLGSYFINAATTSGRTLGIVSTDTNNPATCNLSRLEIRVTDPSIPDTGKPDVLKTAFNKIHRFVRLARRLGWTMRDLDKAIVALQPKNAAGKVDITADFLVQLSHIKHLRAQLGLPVVSLLSFWASIDTGRYLDQMAEGAPPVPSLYAQLFNNRSAAGQLPEDPPVSGELSKNTATISGALQISVDDLKLLLADTGIVPDDQLTLANLSRLYRHATFAKALNYSVRTYLSTLKLISNTPFTVTDAAGTVRPSTKATVGFTQDSERIMASGFSVEDLHYLLRHDFSPTSTIAIGDEAIAVVLGAIREEVRKVTAENSFIEAASDAIAATNDPNGELTKRKLALLNWDTALIEQLIAILNGTFTHEAGLANLGSGIVIDESLKGRLTYDSVAKQLRFTGVMTLAEKTLLTAPPPNNTDSDFKAAVTALFDAPRLIVGRHMRRFSVPRFAADLNTFPLNITFPGAIKSKIYYDTVDKRLNFVGVMTEDERRILLALGTNPSDPTNPVDAAYRQAVQTLFSAPDNTAPAANDVFITSSGTNHDIDALFNVPNTTPPSRFLLVLRKLLPYLRQTLSERIVVQRLSEALRLDSKATHDLLTTWVNSPAHPTQKAITEFLAPSFVETNLNVEVSKQAFPDQFKTFLLLYKIATLTLKFNATSQQLQWLFEFGPGNNWLDLNTLPLDSIGAAHTFYRGWARLADLFQLRDALPLAETLLTDVFTAAHDPTTQLDPLLDKISKGLGWKLDNLKALSGSTGFNFGVSAYKNEVALLRLNAAFTLLNQLGASADQCLSWTKSALTETDERKCAQDVKSLVRAKLDVAQWLERAKALNDPLREKQRSALVSYLVQTRGERSANDLYDDFLIDVEMSPCMVTTRIKQAISSVQLFVQRSLMNLESDVAMTPAEARQWAQWRKQYRMWEANRKVLLYPENWLEPELRDGKSSFYKDLENELLQSDVTMDTAETAFLHYLEKLHEVSRLEIVGMYQQQEPSEGIDVLHVLGRTFSAPHIYYYRRQLDSAYWTPWEKVQADIQGDHLIPVIWNRRLYVFWPIFNIKQQEKPIKMPPAGSAIEQGERMLEIQLAWTEYKNGKWAPKKLAASFLSPLRHPGKPIGQEDFKLFSFKSRIETTPTNEGQLFVDCYGPVELVNPAPPKPSGTSQETYLFTLPPRGGKSVFATVNGNSFQAGDVNNVVILGKNATTGAPPFSTFRLSTNGTAKITNPSTTVSYKYYLVSSVYLPVNLELEVQEQICRPAGTVTQALGDNGDGMAHASIETASAAASIETASTAAASALIGTATAVAAAAIDLDNPLNRVCEIVALCQFDLVPLPGATPSPTPSSFVVAPMQAIVSFKFDDGQQSVSPIRTSNGISSLEPMIGTRFENMMLAEYPNQDGLGESRILKKTPETFGRFRLIGMNQSYEANKILPPYVFQDDLHTYLVSKLESGKFRFKAFYHPTIPRFVGSLNRSGVSGLLTLANQLLTDKTVATDPPTTFNKYEPDALQVEVGTAPDFAFMPREDVDFSYSGAYSIYNWEVFFHVPFMMATQLSKNQRFEEAQKWFHYIFDPTATDSPGKTGIPGPERFWRVKPLYEEALRPPQTLEDLFADDDLEAQVNEWMANPFNPHVIARLRLVAYMKAIVMRYVDNLIAWGDQLFRRDTIESINEATQLYILAAQILGRRPEQVPARAKTKTQTFRTLDDKKVLNSLSNVVVEIEGFVSPSVLPENITDGGIPLMSFFGIPANEKLLGYWNTVGDRLFKIRHCQNIEGVVRSLPTFEPPIDPGLLVKAATAGVDIASALSDISVALPHYRFNIMLQKATELCNDVKALGGALLAALEKRDAEALSLLRSTHEMKVLKAVRTVKEQQLEEAKESRAALERGKELTTLRRNYYRDIAFMNLWEAGHLLLTGTSMLLNEAGIRAHLIAGIMHLVPNVKLGTPTTIGVTTGGENVGQAAKEFGDSLSNAVSLLNTSASMAATMGGYQRRADDWKLQRELADKELEQIERQIAAADIRRAIAERDLRNHDLQVENAQEVDEFMRSKFTNRELYDWMAGQIAGIYFQSYQLAYDVAKRAERGFRYELGLRDSSFIQFGYWDSLKKGLLAGERLSHDLKRMDVAYLDQNKREYEIAKHISLLAIDPIGLVKLKQTGECFVNLPEALFDVDYPGHYMRRIKSVGITVPCVAGPYTGINCTLTLQSSTIRHGNVLQSNKYARQTDDPRFSDSAGTIQSIVTSGAQNDSGLFETNIRDERYLPFEGQGAISSWRIELPKDFKTFDYDTISDVVLHLRYTAREGGAALKGQAVLELKTALNDFISTEGKRGLAQMYSLRHEFSTEWSRFLNPAAGAKHNNLTMPLNMDRFPFLFQSRNVKISAIELFVKVKPGVSDHNKDTVKLTIAAGTTAPIPPAGPGDILGLELWNALLRGSKTFNNVPPGAFTLNAWRITGDSQNPFTPLSANAIQDIIVVCRYTCS